jgi:DNA-binding NtrC family response regulator
MNTLNFRQENSETILFVDSESSVLDNIYSLFPIENKVHTVKTLDAAWKVLRTQKIDCIYCSANLAFGQSAIELLNLCQANGINVPFIMISKDLNHKKILKSKKYKIADVVYKPLNSGIVNSRLKSYFSATT